jgi:hypothetical protein
MPDLPAWLQEICDRVDKATPGPWTAEDANPHKPHKRFAFYIPAIMSAPSMPQYDGLTEEDAEFIAHSRTDVPRLIALVGEMAEKLEGAVTVLDDIAAYGYDISKVPNIVKEAILGRQALAKYHGEAEPTTPNESYWWCESCGCEVDGTRVTYEELHDVCGHPVEWREGDDER